MHHARAHTRFFLLLISLFMVLVGCCCVAGKTADGDLPRQSRPGPFHPRSFRKPLRLALRAAFAPWFLLGRQGTIAADLNEYPFGTRMYVPGYGWGLVSMNESCHERQTDRDRQTDREGKRKGEIAARKIMQFCFCEGGSGRQ